MVEQVGALCVLREQSSPARRTLFAQVPGALARTGEDDACLGRVKRAIQIRRQVRVAASAPVCADLLAPVGVCPRAQTVHLEEHGCIQKVEEEPAAWASGSARALMVRSAHQGQLKMR
jgi:hypothetical protein